jgi:hypothetical protein
MERSGPIGYGNHSDEATANASGTSLLEATRPAIVIVAAHFIGRQAQGCNALTLIVLPGCHRRDAE